MRIQRITSIAWSVLLVSMLFGQSNDVSLRNRITQDYTVDRVVVQSGAAFTIGNSPYYAVGTDDGVMFYTYSSSQINRIGRVLCRRSFYDIDASPKDANSSLLALATGGIFLLWSFDTVNVTPYGYTSNLPGNVTRVQVESLGTNQHLIIAGLDDGRVVCYVWNVPTDHADSLFTPLNFGSPDSNQPFFANAPVHVKVYSLQNGVVSGLFGSGDTISFSTSFMWHMGIDYTKARAYVKVFPSLPSDTPFPIGAETIRFVQGGASTYQQYNYPRKFPVNDVIETAGGNWAAVFGDGYFYVSPSGSPISLGEPGFAVCLAVHSESLHRWLLVSYGSGKVRARNITTGAFDQANILPAPSFPRVISVLRLLQEDAGTIRFVVGTFSGHLEVWQWQLGSNSTASLVSSRQFNAPITDVSISSDKTKLAVCARSLYLVPVDTNGNLNTPNLLSFSDYFPFYNVKFHPTNPNQFVCTNLRSGSYVFTLTSSTPQWTVLGFKDTYGHCAWLSNGVEIITANPYSNHLSLFTTQVNSLWPQETLAPSQGFVGNISDRSLQEVYNPEEGSISSILAMSDGSLLVGTRSGRVVKWTRNRRLLARSYPFFTNAVSFAPQSGYLALTDRVLMPNNYHAMLPSDPFYAVTSLALPGGNDLARVKTRSNYTQIISHANSTLLPSTGSGYYDAPDSPGWVVCTRSYANLHLNGFALMNKSNNYSTFLFDRFSSSDIFHDISPSGNRLVVVAPVLTEYRIRVYTYTSSWDFNLYTEIPDFSLNYSHTVIHFLADDLLLVLMPSGSSTQMTLFQWQGTTWQQVAQLLTPPGYVHSASRRTIDSIQTGTSVRMVLSTNNGLIFYKITTHGGAPTITEVGRSSWIANGFLDVGLRDWIYFSRYPGHNRNYLAVASGLGYGSSVIVYDLQGLFDW